MEQLQQALISLAIAIIPVIGAFLISLLKSKIVELKDKIKYNEALIYIDIAEKAISTVVSSVQQTYVEALKKEGKFDKEAQQAAFDMAKTKSIVLLSQAAVDAIRFLYDDVNEYINDMIEKHVRWDR